MLATFRNPVPFTGPALLALLALAAPANAQQAEPQGGFMVAQWQICPPQNMSEVDDLFTQITPILDELRSEGMVQAWYDVRHAWGDEWNVGLISVFESHRAWLDFWDEFLGRVNTAHPEIFGRLTEICEVHKDNLYTVRDSRGGGM